MLKTFALLAALTCPMFAADEILLVKTLSQKALDDQSLKALRIQLKHEAELSRSCAIRLAEAPALAARHMDPMARPVNSAGFDKMSHPAEVRACQWH